MLSEESISLRTEALAIIELCTLLDLKDSNSVHYSVLILLQESSRLTVRLWSRLSTVTWLDYKLGMKEVLSIFDSKNDVCALITSLSFFLYANTPQGSMTMLLGNFRNKKGVGGLEINGNLYAIFSKCKQKDKNSKMLLAVSYRCIFYFSKFLRV